MDISWAAERTEDFRRHLSDLQDQSYEGAKDRLDRERVFEAATRLLEPVVNDVLRQFGSLMLAGSGSIEDSGVVRSEDGSVERRWSLSWPGQIAAQRRVGEPGPILPIVIRAFFPPGWTHGHLAGSAVGSWPLQIVNTDDAARQTATVWAIAEAEFHQRIYEMVQAWDRVPEPVGAEPR